MKKIVFSDIDGTLSHHERNFAGFARVSNFDEKKSRCVYREIKSGEKRDCYFFQFKSTSSKAFISLKTLELAKKIREKGFLFVIVSATRMSSIRKIKAFLPVCDYYIIENGGVILKNMKPDTPWAKKLDKFKKPLEKLRKELTKDGWIIDPEAKTKIRLEAFLNPTKQEKDFKNILKKLPRGLSSSFNMNMIDIFPKISGKGNAVKYLMNKLKIKKPNAYVMMDDDNDLSMAKNAGKVLMPGISHKNVLKAVKKHPDWIVAKKKLILGTEEVLEKILNM